MFLFNFLFWVVWLLALPLTLVLNNCRTWSLTS